MKPRISFARSSLGFDARRLLSLLAVLSPEGMPEELLPQALEWPEGKTEAVVTSLLRRGVLTRDDRGWLAAPAHRQDALAALTEREREEHLCGACRALRVRIEELTETPPARRVDAWLRIRAFAERLEPPPGELGDWAAQLLLPRLALDAAELEEDAEEADLGSEQPWLLPARAVSLGRRLRGRVDLDEIGTPLAEALDRLAAVSERPEALALQAERLELCRAHLDEEPDSLPLRRAFARALRDHATLLSGEARNAGLTEAVRLLRELVAEDPEDPDLPDSLRLAERALAKGAEA